MVGSGKLVVNLGRFVKSVFDFHIYSTPVYLPPV